MNHAADLSPAAAAPVALSGAAVLVGWRSVEPARRHGPDLAPRCRPPAQPGIPGALDLRNVPEATSSARARLCLRCCSTTTKQSPLRWGCAPPRVAASRGIEEASVRALLKLEQVSAATIAPSCCSAARLHRASCGNRGPTVDAERLSVIAGACRDHEGIRFNYREPSGRSQRAHRRTAPCRAHRVSLVPGRVGPGAQRLANIPRRPHRRQAEDVDALPVPANRRREILRLSFRSLSRSVPYPYRARITLLAPVESIAKRVPPSAGVLEAIDDQSCMLQTGAHSLEGITIHLSLLGVDFRVHEPPELIESRAQVVGSPGPRRPLTRPVRVDLRVKLVPPTRRP